MMSWKLAAGALVAVTAPAVAAAQQDPNELTKQIVNDPGAPEVNGAKAKLVDDPKVESF